MNRPAGVRSVCAGGKVIMTLAAGLIAATLTGADTADTQLLGYSVEPAMSSASNLPAQDATNEEALPAHLKRTIVAYDTQEAPGTIAIDSADTYLYRVNVGTWVVVLPKTDRRLLDAFAAMPPRDNPVPAARQLRGQRNVTSGIY